MQAATAGATRPRRKTRRGKGSSARCKAERSADRRKRTNQHDFDAGCLFLEEVKTKLDHDPTPNDLSANSRAFMQAEGEEAIGWARLIFHKSRTP